MSLFLVGVCLEHFSIVVVVIITAVVVVAAATHVASSNLDAIPWLVTVS